MMYWSNIWTGAVVVVASLAVLNRPAMHVLATG